MPLAGAQARLNGRVRAGVLGLEEELVDGDFYLRWQVEVCRLEASDTVGEGLTIADIGIERVDFLPRG